MTARAGTEEEVANLALLHLGEPEIATLSDANNRARACRIAFGAARDAALRLKTWNFAATWVAPARVQPDSIGTLVKRYALPADCIRVVHVKNADQDAWAVESAAADPAGTTAEIMVLVTNVDAPVVQYIRRVENLRLWDPLALLAFSHTLAAMIAAPLAKASNLRAEQMDIAKDIVGDATQLDAKEKSTADIRPTTSWLRARRTGGR